MQIVLDIDDVLAGTVRALESRLGPADDLTAQHLSKMFTHAELAEVIASREFHLGIPPLDGAPEGVQRLLQRGGQILYATSRPADMEEATLAWLEKWGFPELPIFCAGRGAKVDLLRTHTYDLLIDDQVRYLSIPPERGLGVVAFAYPWNSRWQGPRVRNWQELEEFVGGWKAAPGADL